jgi:hypothetical protein
MPPSDEEGALGLGRVFTIPPQPPVDADTVWLEAGAVTIGVEYRAVDAAALVEMYKDNPAHLAEFQTDGVTDLDDEGVSVHVRGASDGHEYLRFDMFEGDAHYHYIHPGAEPRNRLVTYDSAALGEMLPWVLGRLRDHLPEMLRFADGGAVADAVDVAEVGRVLPEVERLARSAQDARRTKVSM